LRAFSALQKQNFTEQRLKPLPAPQKAEKIMQKSNLDRVIGIQWNAKSESMLTHRLSSKK
jgi:hypothetical protein